MATLEQILSRKYTRQWISRNPDVYSGIQWLDSPPFPTEVEIRAFSATVDTEIATDALRTRQVDGLYIERVDRLLLGLEILCNAVRDIQNKLLITALSSALGNAHINNIQAMKGKIDDARAIL